jgi:two-component system chemotaxis sensor kinase CheA
MNLVSELIIVKNGLETVENNNQNMNEQIEYLERITTNLHDAVMKVRMVPVERVFNRFPRLVRDLARKLNKNLELHMSGEETELDRTVIDEIGDPLVHLIRNACDHGQEMPSERKSRGKNEVGNVYLDAYQDGNNVVIEVADDGNGIDVERVKAKALNNGTISRDQADAMSDQDIVELLFKPSFSTADQISDVSGRGVGLDVVKTKIEALGGDIEVKTKLGKGSTFIIRLPLTLAIIQALMVRLENEKYAIPLNTIQNIEDVKVSDIKYIQNQEVINLRGHVIPIVRLDGLLGIERENNEESMTVVIVNKGDKQAGFVVDGLIGQQEIVIKTLGKYLTNIRLIAGSTILGDGEVALILDVNSLV